MNGGKVGLVAAAVCIVLVAALVAFGPLFW